jgi:hypothetical protein
MTKKREPRFVFGGHVSSEGGPVLIADVEDYASWGGADEAWGDHTTFRVHYYGPLVAKLPPEHLPAGPDEWHQNALVPGAEAAKRRVEELEAIVVSLAPGATRREQRPMGAAELLAKARAAMSAKPNAMEEWLTAWRDHIEHGLDWEVAGERVFHVDVAPNTDYARACDALEGDVALVTIGGDRRGLVWDLEGSGTARVARRTDDRGLLLLRTWVDEDDHERAARAHAVKGENEEAAGAITLRTGRTIIAWAPVHPQNLVAAGADPLGSLAAAAELNPPVQLNQPDMLGVGTLARLVPGRYRAFTGAYDEEEGWSCRWLRLALDEPPRGAADVEL